MSMNPTIAIIGASADRRKYGNKAVRAYLSRGYDVFPINPHETTIEGLKAYASVRDLPVTHLDRISLYVPPNVGRGLLADLASTRPGEVWVNPGAKSPQLIREAHALGLKTVQGCSIVAIGVDPYALEG
jgi:predicted CoA-binding protein